MSISRVHKYPLPLDDWVTVLMPKGAEPLCVQVQRGAPFLWARVVADRPLVKHYFRVAGTGHELKNNVGRYLGTFQLGDGALVFHVFAGKEE